MNGCTVLRDTHQAFLRRRAIFPLTKRSKDGETQGWPCIQTVCSTVLKAVVSECLELMREGEHLGLRENEGEKVEGKQLPSENMI